MGANGVTDGTNSIFVYIFCLICIFVFVPDLLATRDVALYMPFRNALQSPNQVIGLQTLMWHLMRRRVQAGLLDSVSA